MPIEFLRTGNDARVLEVKHSQSFFGVGEPAKAIFGDTSGESCLEIILFCSLDCHPQFPQAVVLV
jgi:hypothetical protein